MIRHSRHSLKGTKLQDLTNPKSSPSSCQHPFNIVVWEIKTPHSGISSTTPTKIAYVYRVSTWVTPPASGWPVTRKGLVAWVGRVRVGWTVRSKEYGQSITKSLCCSRGQDMLMKLRFISGCCCCCHPYPEVPYLLLQARAEGRYRVALHELPSMKVTVNSWINKYWLMFASSPHWVTRPCNPS